VDARRRASSDDDERAPEAEADGEVRDGADARGGPLREGEAGAGRGHGPVLRHQDPRPAAHPRHEDRRAGARGVPACRLSRFPMVHRTYSGADRVCAAGSPGADQEGDRDAEAAQAPQRRPPVRGEAPILSSQSSPILPPC
jgi:hypothetical protein